MPFGTRILAGGGVRFQLFAPAAHAVTLALDGVGDLYMDDTGDGWYACDAPAAGPGSRYRFLIDGSLAVPDPASRQQPLGHAGPSEVIDPNQFTWTDQAWRGRPWEDAVIHEVHVGSFTPEGDFDGIRRRLDHLLDLGVTALELMPVAEGPGRWSWGYDGVLPFAPRHGYGGSQALRQLVDAAHARGLMVLLDVVYNHFGPEGNFLPNYAPAFLSRRHQTPWGAAINFDDVDSAPVRTFFVHNALYWLEEYHLDGLRLDAVHAIIDESEQHILLDIAEAVHQGPGTDREVHLILENDANEARYLRREAGGSVRHFSAQWNDDLHHSLHVLLTEEATGYYADYASDPLRRLLCCLEQGFAWQGEPSPFRGGRPRGEPSADLPAAAFVGFLQNHDQIGNRAAGERISVLAPEPALRAATALLLLAPFPPLLFMGQEWGARQPFPFFWDCEEPLATAVREGRQREFPDQHAEQVPDPCAEETFRAAVLDWSWPESAAAREWFALHRELLHLRRELVLPMLGRLRPVPGGFCRLGDRGLVATWCHGARRLTVLANLGPQQLCDLVRPSGACFYAAPEPVAAMGELTLVPWGVAWFASS
ncbi:MAG: malto-oligosyltrehalose trehalohydrolase [Gammaproteobacteria bacterium]|nr:MAG: malto-oligosyltrehalose trehalohydrolase [Gammaproteobacteria bacterium]